MNDDGILHPQETLLADPDVNLTLFVPVALSNDDLVQLTVPDMIYHISMGSTYLTTNSIQDGKQIITLANVSVQVSYTIENEKV